MEPTDKDIWHALIDAEVVWTPPIEDLQAMVAKMTAAMRAAGWIQHRRPRADGAEGWGPPGSDSSAVYVPTDPAWPEYRDDAELFLKWTWQARPDLNRSWIVAELDDIISAHDHDAMAATMARISGLAGLLRPRTP